MSLQNKKMFFASASTPPRCVVHFEWNVSLFVASDGAWYHEPRKVTPRAAWRWRFESKELEEFCQNGEMWHHGSRYYAPSEEGSSRSSWRVTAVRVRSAKSELRTPQLFKTKLLQSLFRQGWWHVRDSCKLREDYWSDHVIILCEPISAIRNF